MRVNIVAVQQRSGVKDGRAWAISEAQCVGELDRGVSVFTVRLPEKLAGIKPGSYDARFGGYVKEGRLVPTIEAFEPVAGK